MANNSKTPIILITRFSVRSEKFMRAAKIESEAERDQWFDIRSAIFNFITYPSIKAQKIIPTCWYLLFAEGDERLYEKYIDINEDWIKPIFIEQGGSVSSKIRECIQRDFPHEQPIFISRIDNDDALDEKFFSTVVESVCVEKTNEDTFFLHRSGIRWDGAKAQILDYPNNPFITLYSPNWYLTKRNPLELNHTTVLEYKHVFVTSPGKPMWLQTLHGTNASNGFIPKRGGIFQADAFEICRQFNVELPALDALSRAKKTWLKSTPTTVLSGNGTVAGEKNEYPEQLPAQLDTKTARPRRLNTIANLISARSYLEISLCTGETFFSVDVERKVAVGPCFKFDPAEIKDCRSSFFKKTSNEYFVGLGSSERFDLVFLDGLHNFEQILIDFLASLTLTHPKSVIIIDDTVPNDVYSAIPNKKLALNHRKRAGNKSLAWHGDVFKIVVYIHDFCPTLSFATFNSGGNQQTVIWRAPRENYKPILGNLEKISRLDFFWLMENFSVLNPLPEQKVFDLMRGWASHE